MRSPWIEMSCAGTLFSMVRSEAAMTALQTTNFRFVITMHARRRLLCRRGWTSWRAPRIRVGRRGPRLMRCGGRRV
jgi:hypothetical protein